MMVMRRIIDATMIISRREDEDRRVIGMSFPQGAFAGRTWNVLGFNPLLVPSQHQAKIPMCIWKQKICS